jgi:hypothetical protein
MQQSDLPQLVGTNDLPQLVGTNDLPQLVGANGLPQLVGTSGFGATAAELMEALALLKRVAAKVAENPTAGVQVSNVDELGYVGGNKIEMPGRVFVAVNSALALAQRAPLSQDGYGHIGSGSQVAAKCQEGIAALIPLIDVARAGEPPPRGGLSSGAKVAIGVGIAAVLGLGVWVAVRR